MCIAMQEQQIISVSKKSASYSIKRALKAFFKKQQKHQKHSSSIESLESLENLRNFQTEVYYTEIEDNSANEKLAHFIMEEEERHQHQPQEQEIFVPVRFARTEVGTFFWTTNLRPVMNIAPADDDDLVQPAYCFSNSQYPQLQFGDRWAQA